MAFRYSETYISDQFNPHTLSRLWGFVLSDARPALHTVQNLRDGRMALAQEILELAEKQISLRPITAPPPKPRTSQQTGPVIQPDAASTGNAAILREEIGYDVLALALLADKPLGNRLVLDDPQLIGPWRWLRQIWQTFLPILPSLPPELGMRDKNLAGIIARRNFTDLGQLLDHISPIVADHALGGKFHTAIATLRTEFIGLSEMLDTHKNPKELPNDVTEKLLSFLANLTLFCPFSGSELLYRHYHFSQGHNPGQP